MTKALSGDGSDVKSVGVFGSTFSTPSPVGDVFDDVSARVGRVLAESGIFTITGGGSRGCMGIVADEAEAHGGQVLGITIKDTFQPGDEHQEIIMLQCSSLFDRLQEYWKKSDAFIAAPGGVGTMHELLTVAAMARCGIEAKPLLILNTKGYYGPLITMFGRAREHWWLGDAYDKFVWTDTIATGDALDDVLRHWLTDHDLTG